MSHKARIPSCKLDLRANARRGALVLLRALRTMGTARPLGGLLALSLMALSLTFGSAWAGGDEGYQDSVEVHKGTRLEVENHAGEVVIHGWDQDRVQLKADPSGRDEVKLRSSGNVVSVETRTRWPSGAGMVDVELQVPRWMDLKVQGNYTDVEIDDVQGEVDVDVVSGDIFLKGGRRDIHLRSVQGQVEVKDADGKIHLDSTNERLRLTNCKGEVDAEAVNGDVVMEAMDSSNVEAVTVNGDILYDGTMEKEGDYYFSTHNGDVDVAVSPQANLTVSVATFRGDFQCDFPVDVVESRPGKRFKFVLGSGDGQVRIESFQGDIHLFDPKTGRGKQGR